MPELGGVIYETNRQWFDSAGDGSWPKLSPVTVKKKAAQAMPDPSRPLYALGNLYESVTSPNGPYSYMIPMYDGLIIGVSWTAAKALAAGTSDSGRDHGTRIPARPIFPPPLSPMGKILTQKIGRAILAFVDGQNVNTANVGEQSMGFARQVGGGQIFTFPGNMG